MTTGGTALKDTLWGIVARNKTDDWCRERRIEGAGRMKAIYIIVRAQVGVYFLPLSDRARVCHPSTDFICPSAPYCRTGLRLSCGMEAVVRPVGSTQSAAGM